MDVPNTIAAALGVHEICDDLKDAVVSYITTAIADFETSTDDPNMAEALDLIITDLRLMKGSVEARAWGFVEKADVAE